MARKGFEKRIKQQMSEFFEIPGDVILDLPRVVMLGGLQLIVENHKGILKYTSELVCIDVSEGELVIRGRELKLRNVLPEEICVEGHIKSVAFEDHGGGGDT